MYDSRARAMEATSAISGLLTMCGISSVRMFAPAFIFGAICRFLPAYDWCPAGISQLAGHCPAFLTGDFGLCFFGVLGALEIAANWDDTVRDLISDANIDKYAKPVFAALMAFSLVSPEQQQAISAAIGGIPEAMSGTTPEPVPPAESGFPVTATVAALACCGGTYGLCRIRSGIIETVRELDPDNTLHLNTLLTMAEEGSWLAILPVVLVFPIAALALMAVFAVSGWALSVPLRKLAARRRAYWDAVGREKMLKALRFRAIAIFSAGALLSAVPVFGYLATVVTLNIFVSGVISLYEKKSSRILAKLAMRFLKLTLFLFALVFSGIPFMGILLLVPHAVALAFRIRKLEKQ